MKTEESANQMLDCPDCHGKGKRRVDRFVKTSDGCKFDHQTEATCGRCDGDGFISEKEANRIRAGKLIRQARQLLDLSQMEFAKELNIKASDLSDIEMGRKEFKR